MELTSFWDLMFNPVAQAKFVHTVSAGYVTGSMFVVCHLRLLSALGPLPGFRQAIDHRRLGVRTGVGAVRGRSRR